MVWGISPKQLKILHGIAVLMRLYGREAASPDPASKPCRRAGIS
ncbi:hypothetical protein ENTCAN_08753 [Enterobacter cancerogenus ATCC 35316]|nr:hypothetical protein ENTCAN_08753 [Enterobacter cancerogenus ATCC 35316]